MKKENITQIRVKKMSNLETANTNPVFDEEMFSSLDELISDQTGEVDEILESIEEDYGDEEILEGLVEEPVDIMDDLIIGSPTVEEAEVVEVTASSILDEDDLENLDMEVAKQEAYAKQNSKPGIVVAEDGGIPTTAPVVKKAKAKKPSTPRVTRDLSALPDDMFILEDSSAAFTDDDMKALRADFMAKLPAQKKVVEKIEMIMCGLQAGKLPNRYVEIPFKLLAAGKITRNDIMAAYTGSERKDGTSNLNQGTAQAQTGQLMVLLPFLKIANVVGKGELEWNESSRIGAKLKALYGM